MRSVVALLRAAWLTAASYRVAMLLSFAALLASIVPLWFVAGALQPVVAESIAQEGGQYFGFLLVGVAATYLLSSATAAIPSALAGSIGSGTFEALLVTRTPLPLLLAGMAAYPLTQSVLRALVLLAGAAVAGVPIAWSSMPLAAAIAAVMLLAYLGVGLVAGALVLVFRTSGPLTTAVIALSGLLGGVYYSVRVIPSWLQDLSGAIPLTYALRAARMLLLGGAAPGEVLADLGMLALLAATALAIGTLAFGAALRHARRAGTLSQY